MTAVPILGIAVLIGICWAISTDRRRFPWRVVGWSLALQVAFALLVLKSAAGAGVLAAVANAVDLALQQASAGIELLFGPLADRERFGVILAISALPAIVYVASVFSVLYYLGVLQLAVVGMAKVMVRTFGTSGAETLAAAGNVFMGQTEAPLLVAPYLERMTRSELHALMVSGMATVSGGMLAAYIALGVDARFLLAASLVNAPAALMVAKIIVPETGQPETAGRVEYRVERAEVNLIAAAANGATAGMKLLLNVVAMLIAFLSIVALINLPLGAVGLSLSDILGWVFRSHRISGGGSGCRGGDRRRDAGEEGDPQRVRGLPRPRRAHLRRNALGEERGHRDLRALRLREPEFRRNPDRRNRRYRARTEKGPRPPRPAGARRGHRRDPGHRRHRRDPERSVVRPDIAARLAEAAGAVRAWLGNERSFPEVGIVLGSGLAGTADAVSEARSLGYGRIPGMPECSAPGHRSRLVVGQLDAQSAPPLPVALLLGRHHLYEGRTPDEAVFGVRLLGTLGVRRLLLTAAVGAIHPELGVGDFVRVRDHLNLTGASPLEGPEPGPEPRFPDLTRAWDPELGAALERAAARLGTPLRAGIYAGVRGPQFETPAEIRMLRTMGADVVGMSVVLEAIAARHLGIRLAGLAFASNLAAGIGAGPLDSDHVNEAAARAAPDLARLLAAAATEPEFRGE